MRILTIGFTQKSAEAFFGALEQAGVRTVVDIRLHNTSQLAGFAKRDDLRFFLDHIAGIGYRHEPLLAPTEDLLTGYHKKAITWADYEDRFRALLREREVETRLDPAKLDNGCLLCSEAKPDQCHRRLVAEYLRDRWGDVEIVHLI
ncbi:MAG TPA: DUF488 domain-containing protein [Thermomicrobiaceae bacterium]|nr:DUF488 domain-containing protein [Thermomicrobiaceae bacterium]